MLRRTPLTEAFRLTLQMRLASIEDKVREQIASIRERTEELRKVARDVGSQQEAAARVSQEKEQRKQRVLIKSQNYVEELEQLEFKLKHTGFVPELSHGALTDRSAKLKAKQQEIIKLRERLSYFADLPPDLEAANQVFSEKQQQLQAATKQFEDGLAHL